MSKLMKKRKAPRISKFRIHDIILEEQGPPPNTPNTPTDFMAQFYFNLERKGLINKTERDTHIRDVKPTKGLDKSSKMDVEADEDDGVATEDDGGASKSLSDEWMDDDTRPDESSGDNGGNFIDRVFQHANKSKEQSGTPCGQMFLGFVSCEEHELSSSVAEDGSVLNSESCNQGVLGTEGKSLSISQDDQVSKSVELHQQDGYTDQFDLTVVGGKDEFDDTDTFVHDDCSVDDDERFPQHSVEKYRRFFPDQELRNDVKTDSEDAREEHVQDGNESGNYCNLSSEGQLSHIIIHCRKVNEKNPDSELMWEFDDIDSLNPVDSKIEDQMNNNSFAPCDQYRHTSEGFGVLESRTDERTTGENEEMEDCEDDEVFVQDCHNQSGPDGPADRYRSPALDMVKKSIGSFDSGSERSTPSDLNLLERFIRVSAEGVTHSPQGGMPVLRMTQSGGDIGDKSPKMVTFYQSDSSPEMSSSEDSYILEPCSCCDEEVRGVLNETEADCSHYPPGDSYHDSLDHHVDKFCNHHSDEYCNYINESFARNGNHSNTLTFDEYEQKILEIYQQQNYVDKITDSDVDEPQCWNSVSFFSSRLFWT